MRVRAVPIESGEPSNFPTAAEQAETDQRLASRTVRALTITHWDGPTPPPEVLEAYGVILPDAPRQLMDEFFQESKHRRERERALDQRRSDQNHRRHLERQNELADRRQGRYLGFVVAMTAVIAGTILGIYGQPELGGIIGGGAVLTVAITLIRSHPGS